MLRVGIAGVGHLGAIHARLWKEREDVELVGVYDTRGERATAVAAELGIAAFDSLDALLGSVDALDIVTSTSSHAAVAIAAFDRGIHCFIEKPITSGHAEALDLVRRADERGLVLQVGHVERFNPAMLALAGRATAPMFIESHRLAQFQPRSMDVAVVHDLMIHDIDLVLHLVASPVREIRASGVAVISDMIDIANARLEFENGCVANLTASRISQKPMRKMRLFQHETYISLDFAKREVEIFAISEGSGGEGAMKLGEIGEGDRRRSIFHARPALPEQNAIALELEEFVRAIRDGIPPSVDGRAGARAVEIAEAVIAAIERAPIPAGTSLYH
jgi:predicted dehydrogenase